MKLRNKTSSAVFFDSGNCITSNPINWMQFKKKSNLHIKSKGSSAPQIPFCLFVCDMGRVVFRAIERQCLDFNIFVNVNMFLVRLAENDENSGVVLSFL